MADSGSAPRGPRLEGWKEIAAHLGKGVRTAQRWEADLGMPVHRMRTGRGETVHAFAGELDAWQARTDAPQTAQDASPAAPATPASSAAAPAERGAPGIRPARVRRPTIVLTVGAFGLLALLAWAGGTLPPWRRRPAPAAGAPPTAAPPHPATWSVKGGVLRILDADARLLWQKGPKDFGVHLDDALFEYQRRRGFDPVAFHDLDGDGLDEVLVTPDAGRDASGVGLFCFDHQGRQRFRHAPDYRVRFEELACAPPWRAMFARVTGEPGRLHDIWLVSTHPQEFPTVVERLDPAGNVVGAYWNNGHVNLLKTGEMGGRAVVFVGGISNEFKGGTLAVLDRQDPSATAPAVHPHWACDGCPPGVPVAFLVFPRLDVTEAIGDHALVTQVDLDADGRILVQVVHGTGGFAPLDMAASSYVLGPDFRVLKAELGERYPAAHRLFEERNLLKHPFSLARDEPCLWPVQRWEPELGAFVLIQGVEAGQDRN